MLFSSSAGSITEHYRASQVKKAGLRNRLAIVGTIVSAFTTILAIGVLVFFVNMLMTASAKCDELAAGTHYVDATTKIRCE